MIHILSYISPIQKDLEKLHGTNRNVFKYYDYEKYKEPGQPLTLGILKETKVRNKIHFITQYKTAIIQNKPSSFPR